MPFGEIQTIQARAGACVVVLLGEHDVSVRLTLQAVLERVVDENALVVIDLSGAQFVDSSVMGELARAQRRAAESGTTIRLQLGTHSIVRRALEVGGLTHTIACFATRNGALAADESDGALR